MKRGWLLGVMAIALSGCTPFTPDFEKNTADVILRITSVTGQSGDTDFAEGSVLFSDVLNCKEGACSTFNDNAGLSFTVIPKNPLDGTVNNAFNTVTLTNYTVSYTRTDGRAVEGVDVPFAIAGPMGIDVGVGGSTKTSIVAVRHAAKAEAPLKAIAEDFRPGQPNTILVVIAHITVFGRTVNEQNVSASTNLEIHFGDFANE